MYPTDWVRLYFTCDADFSTAKIVVAVDTSLARDEDDKTGPRLSLNPDENIFRLEANEVNICNFLSLADSSTTWMDGYLADLYYDKNDEKRYEQPIKEYLASYILLLQWLSNQFEMPEIQLFTDATRHKTVDLVVDIGNSSTCALLFESKDEDAFDFNNVKKLAIQDFTNPHLAHEQSFPMNLIFSESHFGNINKDNYHNHKFITASLVRIGYEAESLINNAAINLDLGYELKTYNSSPKRYLWDDKLADREWEFQPIEGGTVKKVYLNGISEQLNLDGTLVKEKGLFGSKSLFSKAALMKFVFLELLIHAHAQINSFKFREEHGDMTVPRNIRRITISCPTGMIQHEQIALREAAKDACTLLDNYQKFYYDTDVNNNWFSIPEIIPSIKDLSKKISQLEERQDWIYDEATCGQLVFVYSLMAKKLKGNNYVIDHYLFKNKESLKIASVDIGAGTTDIIVNEYTIQEHLSVQQIAPRPLFWDSFKIAGDDLVKELIQTIIIKGEILTPDQQGCVGVIENYAKEKNVEGIQNKLNGFFGENSNNMGYMAKMMRSAFTHQVAMPIVLKYLEQANSDKELYLRFEEIIDRKFTNTALVHYFEKFFGFSFLDITWKITGSVVHKVVADVYESLIRQIATVFNQFDCDYVVLSGKPASLNSFEAIFRKFLSCSTNNLINLNHYWVGRWYPFSDNNGVINDPKTIVSVGAIIALMSGKLRRLPDFKLDTTSLIQTITSSADFIVQRRDNHKDAVLTPMIHEASFLAKTIPAYLGYSKYFAKNYPYSDLYSIRINTVAMEEMIRQRHIGRDQLFLDTQLHTERMKILQQLPLKIVLSREFDESKELLKIESVEDSAGNDKPVRFFKLQYQTLESESGFWLDTCEFVL